MFTIITPTTDEMQTLTIHQLLTQRLISGNYEVSLRKDMAPRDDEDDEWDAFDISPADLAAGGTVAQLVDRKRARGEVVPLSVIAKRTRQGEADETVSE